LNHLDWVISPGTGDSFAVPSCATAAPPDRHATRPMAPGSRTTVRNLAADADATLEDRSGTSSRTSTGAHSSSPSQDPEHRIHTTLLGFGKPCPVSDLFGAGGRALPGRLTLPEPWIGNLTTALASPTISTPRSTPTNSNCVASAPTTPMCPADDRTRDRLGAGPPIAANLGDIARFPSPTKLCGHSGPCPRCTSPTARPARPAGQERPTTAALGPDRQQPLAPARPYQRSGRLTTSPELGQPQSPTDLLLPTRRRSRDEHHSPARQPLVPPLTTGPSSQRTLCGLSRIFAGCADP
jgi:hypothetical protein